MYIQPKTVKLHTAATATGDGEVVELRARYGSAIIQITGITTGTVVFKGSIDGGNYIELIAFNMTSGSTGTSANANGTYVVPVIGMNYFKAEITVATTITLHATALFVSEVINSTSVDISDDATRVLGNVALTGSTVAIKAKDNTTGNIVEIASQERSDGANILLVAEASLPDGSTAYPLESGTTGVQGITAFATLRLVGFSITENAATAGDARLVLHHGTANTDPELFDVTLAPGESVREWFDLGGIAVPDGVYVNRTDGTTKVILYARAVS